MLLFFCTLLFCQSSAAQQAHTQPHREALHGATSALPRPWDRPDGAQPATRREGRGGAVWGGCCPGVHRAPSRKHSAQRTAADGSRQLALGLELRWAGMHGMAWHSMARHGTGSPSPRRGSQASPRSAGGRGCFSSALLSPQINYRARGDSSAPPGWPARRSIRPRAPPCPQSGCCAVGQPRRPVRNYAMARRTCSGRCFLLGIRRAERRVGTCVG